jgi:tetratricopeptide (TPR) repeat protein
MYLMGHVVIGDGTRVPNDLMIERICNEQVRQQVYASPVGDFSMQLGGRADSFLDASGDRNTSYVGANANRDSLMGIPRRDLTNCELKAKAAGLQSNAINLVNVDNFGSTVDVGTIVVQRTTKVEGMTLSATPYKAPKDALRAYEKGIEAKKKGKLENAQGYFESAVAIYPKYLDGWFQLGTVLEKGNQTDAARKAFTQAITIDAKFLAPYLALAAMAYKAGNWSEVLEFTGRILDRDPLNRTDVSGYVVDLDPLNYAEAYFYNAVANYKLNKFEDAEKSGLKAEHLDLRTNFLAQLHLLLAKIYARKNNYAGAISELQTYLELVPQAKDADQLREQLAQMEKLNGSAPASEKPEQN